ncbi:MAG: serine/threonine protein kinase [Deltaproteobacteria bacterium]|nr:serine/threonine protein kinase [Deltaproteobacteria bacterium]
MMTVERARPPQIGEYEIVGLLGTGGMAEIFLGRQTATGFQRPVVIKRVLQHLVRQESFVAMFLDEARTLASLRHPNIVQIYDVQRSPEELYMVMEYVEGEDAASVRRRLNHRDETLPRALWAYVLSEVCAGLHAAHQLADHNGRRLNLVHRDISPSNVLITYDGAVKLIDFGIAKTDTRSVRTAAGQVKGVFAYMSPEQASGRPIDLRSDLFAIGILLYEFTTGRRLFRRANDLATMQAVCTDPIPPPSAFAADYPPALEAVVMKALQRDPNDRYQSALELRRDLLAVARQFEGIPEELIKVVMQSVFEDRIELKRSILSDQHEAWSRDRMDSVVEVPMVPGHLTMTPSLEVPEEPSDPSADALAYSGVPTDGRGRSQTTPSCGSCSRGWSPADSPRSCSGSWTTGRHRRRSRTGPRWRLRSPRWPRLRLRPRRPRPRWSPRRWTCRSARSPAGPRSRSTARWSV